MLSFAPNPKNNSSACLEADQGRMMLQQLAGGRKPNVEMVIMWTDRVRDATARCEASRSAATNPIVVDSQRFELQKLCISSGRTLQQCGLN
jgi:hypothetical protein